MTTAAAPPRSPYLVSARYDAVWFLGSMAVPYAMGLVYWLVGPGEHKQVVVALYVAFQLLFNLPHNAQTWSLTVLEPHERQSHARRYQGSILLAVGLLAGTMALSPTWGWPLLNSAVIYWGYWHLIKQHFGFVRLYEMRRGVKDAFDKSLSRALLYVAGVTPLIQRVAEGNVTLDSGRGVPMVVAHPAIPMPLATGAWIISGVLLVLYVGRCLMAWRQGKPTAPLAVFTLLGALFNFWVSLQLIDDLIVGVVVMTVWHNLQYLGLVFFMSGNRARLQGGGAQLVKLAGDGRVGAYVGVLLVYAVVILACRVLLPEPWGAFPITLVVALHYFHDSFIWKISSNPTLRQELGMKAP